MPSVYIETTIPSFYHETRTSATIVAWREATRRWWDHHRHAYRLFTSNLVIRELELAPSAKAAPSLVMLRDVPRLMPPGGFADAVRFYIEHQLMPEGAEGDAGHVALASMHRIDFLLTWNCRHLANANKVRHLRVLNARLGLPTPDLITPYSLLDEASTQAT